MSVILRVLKLLGHGPVFNIQLKQSCDVLDKSNQCTVVLNSRRSIVYTDTCKLKLRCILNMAPVVWSCIFVLAKYKINNVFQEGVYLINCDLFGCV